MKMLETYRKNIDAIDDRLVALLEERFEIVRKVGHYKWENNLPVVQDGRVEEVRNRARALALKHNLDPDFIVRLYDAMIDHAHHLEDGIKEKHESA